MLLRLIVILLLLANGLYFAWTQGHLAWLQSNQHEPQRLTRQIQSDAIKVTALNISSNNSNNIGSSGSSNINTNLSGKGAVEAPSTEPLSAATSAEAPATVCSSLAIKPANSNTLRQQIERVVTDKSWTPAVTWQLRETKSAEHWLIYMGPYKAPDLMAKKKQELNSLKIPFETVTVPALQPGLSLGGFDQLTSAQEALKRLNTKGIRTAVIKQDSIAASQWTLMLKAPNTDRMQALLGQQQKLFLQHALDASKPPVSTPCT